MHVKLCSEEHKKTRIREKGSLMKKVELCLAAVLVGGFALAGPKDELSGGFWVRFGSLPGICSPADGVTCAADADGKLTLTFKARPEEILGDWTMSARDRIARGEWHHVAYNYSMMRRRTSVYLDGHWQWENADLELPHLSGEGRVDTCGCELKDVTAYPNALESERLTVVAKDVSLPELERIAAEARALAAKAPTGGLKGWMADLAKRAGEAAAKERAAELPSLTVAAFKAMKRELRNAAAYAAAPKSALADGFAVQVTEALSQEPVMPFDIPKRGEFTDATRLFLCPNESEAASLVVHAFRPLTVKNVAVGELSGPGGAKLKVRDVSLVKRWYRSGLAWLAYHNDRRVRTLVPDLLLHDADLIRVDEEATRNYLRLDWPTGRAYVDCSDPDDGFLKWEPSLPFRDADTLQPVAIPAAGRNQQFLLTFRAEKGTKPGDYRGTARIETDAGTKDVKLLVKVLPIELPDQGSPYDNLERTYISHVNSMPDAEGATHAERVAFAKTIMKDVREHSVNHLTDAWQSPESTAIAREEGFVPDRVFGFPHASQGGGRPPYWLCFFPGFDKVDLTQADRAAGMRAAKRASRRWKANFDKSFPGSEQWALYHSESSAWITLALMQGEENPVLHDLGIRLFAHGWDNNSRYATDSQDMHSSTAISSEEAQRWHSAGGEVINYADPFPGSENPMWFRMRPGAMMYFAGYDGQMMHGLRQSRTPWNEWAVDWGGDGTYRNFCLCYPMKGGWIRKLAWEGFREAYEDVRYYTCLKRLATKYRDAADNDLRREARRQLRWLDRAERDSTDQLTVQARREAPDLAMLRAGVAERILTLMELEKKGGK